MREPQKVSTANPQPPEGELLPKRAESPALSFSTLPDAPSDEEVARIAAKLGAPISL